MATTDEKFDRIDSKLDDIRDKASDVKVAVAKIEEILVAQHATLVDHTTRSTNLEERIVPLERQAVIFGALGKISLAVLGSGLIFELVKFFWQ